MKYKKDKELGKNIDLFLVEKIKKLCEDNKFKNMDAIYEIIDNVQLDFSTKDVVDDILKIKGKRKHTWNVWMYDMGGMGTLVCEGCQTMAWFRDTRRSDREVLIDTKMKDGKNCGHGVKDIGCEKEIYDAVIDICSVFGSSPYFHLTIRGQSGNGYENDVRKMEEIVPEKVLKAFYDRNFVVLDGLLRVAEMIK